MVVGFIDVPTKAVEDGFLDHEGLAEGSVHWDGWKRDGFD